MIGPWNTGLNADTGIQDLEQDRLLEYTGCRSRSGLRIPDVGQIRKDWDLDEETSHEGVALDHARLLLDRKNQIRKKEESKIKYERRKNI
eukprot:3898579-Rhodomonas_salina.7